ncbi:ATP-binding cassette domain-containing protein [Oscillospiraceae bacterium PP1C4]
MQHSIMEIRNVGKRYSDAIVLDDASIKLEQGSAYCVIGYNGSGKSTLAKIISGECAIDSGSVLFDGMEYDHWNTRLAVSLGVVMISEYSSLFPSETVYENMQHSLISVGKNKPLTLLTQRKRLLREIDEFTKHYGISCAAHDLVREMNNGDRVLLEFLRAKLLGVRVLAVDEIDVALGNYHKETIKRILKDFKRDGVSILYISHKLDMVLTIADSISLIQYGKLVEIQRKDGFEENEIIEIMFRTSMERAPKLYKKRGEEIFTIHRKLPNSDFSLELYEGEIVGIVGMGHNDSMEFHDLLFGSRPKDMTVSVGNRRIKKLDPQKTLENGIVFMSAEFMHLSTFASYSVCQNMLPFNVVKKEHSKERRNQICQRYINILNIKATPSALIDTLSLGHQRKVFIARSILSKGEVFIFDNPTDSIDSVSKIDIYNIINELKTQGKGIIIISNDLQEIMGISDRIITMQGHHITGRFENNGISGKKLMNYLRQEETRNACSNPICLQDAEKGTVKKH